MEHLVLHTFLQECIPLLCALSLASLTVLVSNSFKKENKIMFQAGIFGTGLASCLSYLILINNAQLLNVWSAFASLAFEIRFCIAVVLIAIVYFGGAMYVISPDDLTDSSCYTVGYPASCDAKVGFEIPFLLIPDDDKTFFEQMFERIRKEILVDLPTIYEMPEEACDWIDRMLSYTVAGGKMNRGLTTLSVCQTFAETRGHVLSTKERCQAAALGWCIEFLQASFLVADDLMDNSETRRGQPCWFRLNDVRLIAVNDSLILENMLYKILKRYFGGEVYYNQLVDLFLEVSRQTELGQLLDLTSQQQPQFTDNHCTSSSSNSLDLDRFTMTRYMSIVKYKTAFYSFYLPVAAGMIVSNITDTRHYNTARKILTVMGEYFQIQDDYLDCYGAPEVIGKIGTDIQECKCSWLIVQALQRVNNEQRSILQQNYGCVEPDKVRRVKELYKELQLDAVFQQYEDESYQKIQNMIADCSKQKQGMPVEVYEFLLRKIYRRNK